MIQKEQSTMHDSINVGPPPASLIEEVEGGDIEIPEETEGKKQESLNAGPPPITLIDEVEGDDYDMSEEAIENADSV